MRFAAAMFTVAVVLFAAGATSAVGSWAVSAACLLFLTAAIAGAVAMEERDQVATRHRAEAEPVHLEVA